MSSGGEHVCVHGRRQTGTVTNQARSEGPGVHAPYVRRDSGGWVLIPRELLGDGVLGQLVTVLRRISSWVCSKSWSNGERSIKKKQWLKDFGGRGEPHCNTYTQTDVFKPNDL